jgi:hypothetical protein
MLALTNRLVVRVKCSPDDTVGDLKKLIAAQTGTDAKKIVLKKWCVLEAVPWIALTWRGQVYNLQGPHNAVRLRDPRRDESGDVLRNDVVQMFAIDCHQLFFLNHEFLSPRTPRPAGACDVRRWP